jgi:chorismate mutase
LSIDQKGEFVKTQSDSVLTVCRGVRGATVVSANAREPILEAARDLVERIVAANAIDPADIASVFLTVTPDLDAAYPAAAVRSLGWADVPLLCAQEIAVPGGLSRVIRVLIHWNTPAPQHAIRHVYINGAEALRPDLAAEEEARS